MKDINAQNELNEQYPSIDGIIYTLIEGGKTLLIIGCILSLIMHISVI